MARKQNSLLAGASVVTDKFTDVNFPRPRLAVFASHFRENKNIAPAGTQYKNDAQASFLYCVPLLGIEPRITA
jgi:hypothetical protein